MKTLRPDQIPVNRIRALRRARRWSQYDLERASGISQSRLSLLERRFRPLSEEDVGLLAQVFGVGRNAIVEDNRISADNNKSVSESEADPEDTHG